MTPFKAPPGKDIYLMFFIQIIEMHRKYIFFYLFAPWQDTLADAGDGDGGRGGGTIWDYFDETILRSF